MKIKDVHVWVHGTLDKTNPLYLKLFTPPLNLMSLVWRSNIVSPSKIVTNSREMLEIHFHLISLTSPKPFILSQADTTVIYTRFQLFRPSWLTNEQTV